MATGPVKPPARKASAVKATSLRVGPGTPVARQPALPSPAGGTTIDTQARASIDQIITVLEQYGLVTPN